MGAGERMFVCQRDEGRQKKELRWGEWCAEGLKRKGLVRWEQAEFFLFHLLGRKFIVNPKVFLFIYLLTYLLL